MQSYVKQFSHSPAEMYLGDRHEAFDQPTRRAYSLWSAAGR
jgi:hypothetical protein